MPSSRSGEPAMLLRRRARVALVVVSMCLGVVHRGPTATFAAEPLPSRLSDKAFWQLVTEFSEAGGYFRSDNFLSNENAFQTVIPELKATLPPGGAYIGVGPEQNFTYIVALRPRLAFVVDIRRQNMIEQLLYKALVEMSSSRAEFLSRLFARRRPANVPSSATVDTLFASLAAATPSEELFKENLQAAKDRLVKDHRFALSADDLRGLEYVYSAFFRGGPDLNYSFSPQGIGGGFGGGFPSYQDLMLETDGQGERRSYLASEENFRILREYQKNNAIVPIVGDFGGDKALRAVGEYIRSHGATVTVFYTSNVEQYLFQEAYAWRRFLMNVATFPLDGKSTFVRSISNRGFTLAQFRRYSPGARASTALCSMSELIKAFNAGQIHQYTDVVAMSK
jgi:hypothetical protein